jgi:hypothetical protein
MWARPFATTAWIMSESASTTAASGLYDVVGSPVRIIVPFSPSSSRTGASITHVPCGSICTSAGVWTWPRDASSRNASSNSSALADTTASAGCWARAPTLIEHRVSASSSRAASAMLWRMRVVV